MVINDKSFQIKKFLIAILEFIIYLFLIMVAVIIGYFQHEDEGTMNFIIKTITYLFVYAYVSNILKNMNKLFPTNIPIKYLFYVVSFEIVKKLPYWENFVEKNEKP